MNSVKINLQAIHSLQLKECPNLLDALRRHDAGYLFEKPVAVEDLQLFDYHKIIKTPMDFGTIRRRLEKQYYRTPFEFVDDVRLTFNNSLQYNPVGTDSYKRTLDIYRYFEKIWPFFIESKAKSSELASPAKAKVASQQQQPGASGSKLETRVSSDGDTKCVESTVARIPSTSRSSGSAEGASAGQAVSSVSSSTSTRSSSGSSTGKERTVGAGAKRKARPEAEQCPKLSASERLQLLALLNSQSWDALADCMGCILRREPFCRVRRLAVGHCKIHCADVTKETLHLIQQCLLLLNQ